MDADESALAFDARRFHFVREAQKYHEIEEADDRVEKELGVARDRHPGHVRSVVPVRRATGLAGRRLLGRHGRHGAPFG